MNKKYYSPLVCAATLSLILGLTACHSTKHPANAGNLQNGEDAQSMGAEDQAQFDENGNPIDAVNEAKAPRNQTYYFEFDQSSVSEQDMPAIRAQANYLLSHPDAKVRIEGHTDEKGSREYNITLGWHRAKSVVAIMDELGVPAKQLNVVSFGEEKPVAFAHDESAWHANRRSNLVYESK